MSSFETNRELDFFLESLSCWGKPSQNRPSLSEASQGIDSKRCLYHFQRNDIVPAGLDILKNSDNDELVQSLRKLVKQNSVQNLMYFSVLAKLSDDLKQAGIRFLTLKGPSLSQHLFGSGFYRQFGDLDIFISPKDVDKLQQLFEELGYTKIYPSGELSPFKEKLYRKRDNFVGYRWGKTLIEVHWRLFENDHLLHISFDDAWAKHAVENINGISVPRLGDSQQFLYICAHGAKHQWIRLKWVEDIAAYIRKSERAAILSFLEEAKAYQLTPVLVSALELANYFFKTEFDIPAQYITKKSQQLTKLALTSFYEISTSKSPTGHKINMAKVFLRQFALKSSPRFKIALLSRWAVNTEDWVVIPLPDAFFPLYFAIRPFLWLKTKIFDKSK